MEHYIQHILVDTDSHLVSRYGEDIKLTRTEWLLLCYLIDNKGKVCTRSEILDAVWGQRFQYDTGTIDVHLNALRRKLGFSKNYPIEAIRGVGLILHADADSGSEAEPVQMRQNLEWAKLFTSLLPNNLKTCNLRDIIVDVAGGFTDEIEKRSLKCGMKLDPYVNEIITDEDTLKAILSSVLTLLIRHATNGGSLLVSSKLNLTDFLITLQADGFCPDFNVPEIIAAQRFAALLWMPMQMTNSSGKMEVELRVPLKRL
ncbi:MAG: winged helix-turn-helix transcriptional regulator [Paludibacteraceae bacterium]|nr:winged helix-turn-helix transcriptional regulator [Paludibacteraceae bacterium]